MPDASYSVLDSLKGRPTMKAMTFAAILILLAIALGAPSQGQAADISVSGKVSYRERVALPEGVTLQIGLVETSGGKLLPVVEAQTMITHPGQVPLPFTLSFDSALIQPGRHYALTATISTESSALFSSATPYAIDPLAPAAPILLWLNLQPQEPPAPPISAIANIDWRLTSIGNQPVASDAKASFMVGEDGRVGGSGGCNRYFAQAEIAGNRIDISAIASTRMACASNGLEEAEDAFFAALNSAKSYVIDGDTLSLIDGGGHKTLTLAKGK